MHVSLFAASWATEPAGSGPVTKVYEAFKGGRWKDKVEGVRRLANSEAAYQNAKRSLPAVSFSCSAATRRDGASPEEQKRVGSGRLQVDLDDQYDTDEAYDAVKAALLALPWIEAVFRSVRPTSLKAVARIPASANDLDHLASYIAVERALADVWLTLDPACKDIGRLCFVTYDPDLVYRDASEIQVTAADREAAVRRTDDPQTIHTWTDANAGKLLAQLEKFSGTCRHNEAGAWAGNAVLLGAHDDWIGEQLRDWFERQGRTAGRGEIKRAITWARTRSQRGALKLMGPGAHKLVDPLWVFDGDEELQAPTPVADDGPLFVLEDPVVVAKAELAVKDAEEFDAALVPDATGLVPAVVRLCDVICQDPQIYARANQPPQMRDSAGGGYHNAICWLAGLARTGGEYLYRDGLDWIRKPNSIGWTAIAPSDFDRRVLADFGPALGDPARASGATAHLRAVGQQALSPRKTDLHPMEAAFKNGVLDFDFWLRNPIEAPQPTAADLFIPYEPRVAWDATAECPTWLQFLASTKMGPDGEALLQEWFGWNLVRSVKHHKFLVIVGPRRAGKGTILNVLTDMLGHESVGAASLAALDANTRFGLNGWVGKRAVLFPDENNVDGRGLTAAFAALLQVTSFDRIPLEKKGKDDGAPVRLFARLTMCCNTIPDFPDKAGALSGRMLVLPLTESFLDREDIHLGDKLAAETEGIVVWAAEGLRRLMRRGAFTVHGSAADMKHELSLRQSPVKEFAESHLTAGDEMDDFVVGSDLFDAFNGWAPRANRLKRTSPHLHAEIRGVFPRVESKRVGDRNERRLYGLKWTDAGRVLLESVRGTEAFGDEKKKDS